MIVDGWVNAGVFTRRFVCVCVCSAATALFSVYPHCSVMSITIGRRIGARDLCMIADKAGIPK